MKRFLTIIITLLMIISLCACGRVNAAWQEQFDVGARFLSEGNYAEAIIAFTAAIEIDPQNADGYIGRADAYLASEEIEDYLLLAKADYQKAIELSPKDPAAYQKGSEVHMLLGEYTEALSLLYRGQEVSESPEIEAALSNCLERLSFSVELTDPGQVPKASFTDTSYLETDWKAGSVYLVLTDQQTGLCQVAAELSLCYVDHWIPDESDIQIIENKGDTWLFFVFVREGVSSTFLYTAHTNQLLILEPCLTKWSFTDDYMIGETITFAVDNEEDIFIYNWAGELVYHQEGLIDACIAEDNTLYYTTLITDDEKMTYPIYQMELENFKSTKVCSVDLPLMSYLNLDNGEVSWYDNRMKTSYSMSFQDLHDVPLAE